MPRPASLSGLLKRLALHRPELRAWALYDWANSAMITVIVTAVFPIYYATVAARSLEGPEATQRFTVVTTISLVVAAVLAPLLGKLADRYALKKKLLGVFLALGVLSTGAMSLIGADDLMLASVLFALANIGAVGSFVFYDALLPHVAREDELDQLSTSGYALGYLGGGVVLGVLLLLILSPGTFGLPVGEELSDYYQTLPTRIAFGVTALWWLVFSIPLFRRVREPAATDEPRARGGNLLAATVRDLRGSLRDLLGYRQAALLLVAFLIYNDGIATFIRMAAIFGTELGLEHTHLITAILIVQFVGIPCTLGFGALAQRVGARPMILVGLAVYAGIAVLAWRMTTSAEFYLLAGLVALVQGGTQALSRSLFASLIPRARSAEFFSLFAVLDRFAGIAGPALFGLMVWLTGSSRYAVLPLILFFVVGGILLLRVDVGAGRRQAQEDPTATR